MSFFAVMGITISYVQDHGLDGKPAGMISLTVFVLLMSSFIRDEETGNLTVNIINKDWTGGKGMITAIVVGLVCGIVYTWFIKKDIRIKLPESVPPNVASSFTALIPGAVLITLAMIVYMVLDIGLHTTFFDFIYNTLQLPLQGMTDSLGGSILMGLLIPLFWFFGVHGSTIVGGIMGPILTANSLDNQAIFDSGQILNVANGGHIVTQQFLDQFMTVTGAGMTIGIVMYMSVFARSKQYRQLGKLSIATAIFNINEPIIFATPLVMNPLMLIPFVLTPVISGLITYFAMYTGIVPLFKAVLVPWTTPPIISGLLVGGVKIAILQTVVLILSFFIYLPFIKKMDELTLNKTI